MLEPIASDNILVATLTELHQAPVFVVHRHGIGEDPQRTPIVQNEPNVSGIGRLDFHDKSRLSLSLGEEVPEQFIPARPSYRQASAHRSNCSQDPTDSSEE
jgi:hypothetical protein